MVYLPVLDIIGFKIKVSLINIIRSSRSDESISNIFVYIR